MDHPRAGGEQANRYGPVGLGKEAYKCRNVIERSFNTLKQWRGLDTRYDKLARTCRGGTVLSAIISWLHELEDTP